MSNGSGHSEEVLRRHQIGLLAREMRRQMEWQSHLGLQGGHYAEKEEYEAVTAGLRKGEARLAEALRRQLDVEPPSRPKPQRQAPQQQRASAGPRRVNTRELTRSGGTLAAHVDPRTSEGLDRIRADLGDCRRCKLCQRRQNIVFGVGNPQADLVFVGEAPGFNEDKTGVPFVGQAGKLLTKMIGAMGYDRNSVYICNVIKCRPAGNRDPEPDEIEACEPFLIRQLESIKPKCIVTLGRYASQTLLRTRAPITRIRGQWGKYQGVQLMPTFHPAYLLHNPGQKRQVWEDLKKVMAYMQQNR